MHGISDVAGTFFRLLGYAGTFILTFFRPRTRLALEVLALRSQLASCRERIDRGKAPRPKFTPAFRLLWVLISKLLDGWGEMAQLMQPATVVKWHRRAFRLYWRWKSKPGRPPISAEMQAAIRRLSRENPLWGAERIREELAALKYDPPCEDTIRKYMVKPRKPRKEKSATWIPFLRNHPDVSWAMDFFTVVTVRFRMVYVFVILAHGRRKVVHCAATYNPSMPWVVQQLRDAMPWDIKPKYMFLDNDGIYGLGVPGFLHSCEIEEVRISYRSPWQNPYVERFVGTLRRELLDHVIVLGKSHLEKLLREFIEDYYHPARPHQSLQGETPLNIHRDVPPGPTKLVSTPICGGLHHKYARVAA
jgi:hypothetical protein